MAITPKMPMTSAAVEPEEASTAHISAADMGLGLSSVLPVFKSVDAMKVTLQALNADIASMSATAIPNSTLVEFSDHSFSNSAFSEPNTVSLARRYMLLARRLEAGRPEASALAGWLGPVASGICFSAAAPLILPVILAFSVAVLMVLELIIRPPWPGIRRCCGSAPYTTLPKRRALRRIRK